MSVTFGLYKSTLVIFCLPIPYVTHFHITLLLTLWPWMNPLVHILRVLKGHCLTLSHVLIILSVLIFSINLDHFVTLTLWNPYDLVQCFTNTSFVRSVFCENSMLEVWTEKYELNIQLYSRAVKHSKYLLTLLRTEMMKKRKCFLYNIFKFLLVLSEDEWIFPACYNPII